MSQIPDIQHCIPESYIPYSISTIETLHSESTFLYPQSLLQPHYLQSPDPLFSIRHPTSHMSFPQPIVILVVTLFNTVTSK